MEQTVFPKKPYFCRGGAKTPHFKNTAGSESVSIPLPQQIVLPVQQHIGAPCVPCVKAGDRVLVGQLIADSTAFVSAPIHSSVSGTVKKIAKIKMPNGSPCDAVFIEPDGLQEKSPDIRPPEVTDRESLIAAIRASGCVGLGGAGFPTHVKLNVTPDKADTLIVNGAECEPYITCDHREILENSWSIMSGLYSLQEILGFKRIIIGVENNKPDAIKLLESIAESETYDPEDHIKVLKLKSSYPQGAEKVLVHSCTGRTVPTGKLPLDAGCVVINITTLSFIADYLKTGMPLVKKRITVDGSAVGARGNYVVPVGMPISDVLDFCKVKNAEKVLMGGPMMGVAVSDLSTPVLKQNNAILAFTGKDAGIPPESACINCGRCITSCPMRLQPVRIQRAAARKDTAELEKLGVMNCIECGCCTYNCPAKRYITQQMRIAKAILRESKQK